MRDLILGFILGGVCTFIVIVAGAVYGMVSPAAVKWHDDDKHRV